MSLYTDYKATLNPAAVWRANDASSPLVDDVAAVNLVQRGIGTVSYQVPGLVSTDPGKAVEITTTPIRFDKPPGDGVLDALNISTIEMWIKPTVLTATNYLIGRRSATGVNLFGFALVKSGNNSNLEAIWRRVGVTGDIRRGTTNTPIVAGNIHHIIATFDAIPSSEAVNLHIDGILQTSVDGGTMVGPGTNDQLAIGTSGFNANPFTGVFAHVSLYNAELAASEIAKLHRLGVRSGIRNRATRGVRRQIQSVN